MARSSPALAALLVLLMIGGRVLTTACEIACAFDAGSAHTAQADRPTTAGGHGCHEPTPAPLVNHNLLWSHAPHSACGHQDAAEPFVLAVKLVLKADLHVAKLTGSTRVEPLTSNRQQARLQVYSPPDTSAAPVAPLRI